MAIDPSNGICPLTNSDMAEKACREALMMAGKQPEEVDLIIYSSITPDYLAPPNFTLLQGKLGIDRCMGFDIRSGCAGFGTAVIVAHQFIQTGLSKTALVVGADLMSTRYWPIYKHPEAFPTKALFNLMFFGDAAGALVLEASENGIFGVQMGAYRSSEAFGSQIVIGGSVYPYPTDQLDSAIWPVTQDGAITDRLLPEVLIEGFEIFCEKWNCKLEEFDHIIFPVYSEKIKLRLLEHFPGLEKVNSITIGHEGGALINAAVPLSIWKGIRQMAFHPNDKILIYAGENTRWQHAIIGLTWK